MNNSELLYLYDAKLTNPNGDPDEENRPRMDAERDINLVTDVRLKRYIRDYFFSKGINVYVRKVNDEPVTPDEIIKIDEILDKEDAIKKYIDVRIFGATIAVSNKKEKKQLIDEDVEEKEKKNKTITVTGPVQFNWGYSLNKVEVIEAGITSHFKSKEKVKQSTMGRDYRVKYSFIAFSGAISGLRAEKTKLSNEDIKLLDESMVYAIPSGATRSKIGQAPRLYIRVEYKDNLTYNGDLRGYIDLKEKNELRDIAEVEVDLSKLKAFFEKNKNEIERVYYYKDEKLTLSENGRKISNMQEILSGIPSEIVK